MNRPPTDPVLIVEDDPAVRLTMEWALEGEELPFASAADGQEAVDWIETTRPGVVVLDIGLPIVDGFGVAERLRARYGAVPVVVVTADGHAPEKARRVGAVDYLNKPFDVDRFLTAVRGALGRGSV